MADEVKNKGIKGLNLTPRQMEKLLEEYGEGSPTKRELEILKRYKEAGKEERDNMRSSTVTGTTKPGTSGGFKDPKPKKNPIGADLLYVKKGGLIKKYGIQKKGTSPLLKKRK